MPSDWIYVAGSPLGVTVDRSVSVFVPIGGNLGFDGTESNTQLLARAAYTWLNISARVTQNNLDATTSILARLGGVDQTALEVQIAANSTGYFEDTTGSVAVADGDLINYRLQAGSGAHGDTIAFRIVAGQLQHTSLERPMVISALPSSEWNINESATEFNGVVGALGLGTTTEAFSEYLLRQGVTFSNMRVVISSNNTDNASTFDLREDGVSSTNLTISIAANTTGAFEDTDSEAVVSGSTVNYRMVAGAGMSGDAIQVVLTHMLQGGVSVVGRNLGVGTITTSATFAPGQTRFLPLEGGIASSTSELSNQVEAPMAFQVQNMFVRVTFNSITTANTNIAFSLNSGGSALSVNISAGSTGTFEDTVDTVDVALDDLIVWRLIVAAGGSGTIRVVFVGLEQIQVAAAVPLEVLPWSKLGQQSVLRGSLAR